MRKNIIVAFGAMAIMSMTVPMVAYAEAGSNQQTQATQSPRWYEQSGVWYLRNEQGTGNVTNSWFQDLDQSWYVLSPTGNMYAGLIHDNITGKDYYLQINHDGYYGRMAVTDGVYNVNGQNVYLTFNQSHDGTYGSITSGLDNLRNAGVPITNVDGLPTDSATSNPTPPAPQKAPPKSEEEKSYEDKIREKYGITDEMWEQNDFPDPMYGSLS